MLECRQIVVFGEDFNRHPHCLEHLVRRLLPGNQVLWVETIGMRSPRLSLYDVKRIAEKLWGWMARPSPKPGEEPPLENLTKISPFMIPYNQFRWVRDFNRRIVVSRVKRAMRALGFEAPLLITSIPSTCDFFGELGESFSVYYCVDEFSLWPGIDPHVIGPMEDALLSKVDLVLVTSRALFESKQSKNPRTDLLSHGVDLEHFRPGRFPQPPLLRPRVGFFGLIDDRLDLELILRLVRRFPGTDFHFVGEVVVDISLLREEKNLVWRGKVPYTELPRVISDFSLFILPYRLNELTRHINPLKIKEYMATGKPVVATSLAELEIFEDAIFLARNPDDFRRGVGEALAGSDITSRERQRAHLQGESWEDKACWLSRRVLELETR